MFSLLLKDLISDFYSTKQWFQSPFGNCPPSQYSNNSQCLSTYAVIIQSDKIKTLTKRDHCTSIFVFCVNVSTCPRCQLAPFCPRTGRPPSSVVRCPSSSSSSAHFKHLLIRNYRAIQSQISLEASLGSGNEILLKPSWSDNQGGRHTHIW